MRKTLAAVSAALLLLTGACSSAPKKKESHSQVYVTGQGQPAAYCYNPTSQALLWYLYVSSVTSTANNVSLTGGSWKPYTAGVPAGLVSTNKAVTVDEEGAPTEEVEEAASAGDLVEEGEDAQDAQGNVEEAPEGDDSGGGDGGGGGDSGGSDGGGGGGDAGGGGE